MIKEVDLPLVAHYLKQLDEIAKLAGNYLAVEGGRFINHGPSASGVYFLFDGECLVYVGQASNIAQRLAAHFNTNKKWDRAAWLEVEEKCHRDFVEAHYITANWPIYNDKVEHYPSWANRLLPGGIRKDRPIVCLNLQTGEISYLAPQGPLE